MKVRILSALLCVAMLFGIMSTTALAAEDVNFDVVVNGSVISLLKNGRVVSTQRAGSTELRLRTSRDGVFQICYYDPNGAYKAFGLGNQKFLQVSGTLSNLTLLNTLSSSVVVYVDSECSIGSMTIANGSGVAIAGSVGSMDISGAAGVDVKNGGYIKYANITNPGAAIISEEGGAVGEVTKVDEAEVSGYNIGNVEVYGENENNGGIGNGAYPEQNKIPVTLKYRTTYLEVSQGTRLGDVAEAISESVIAFVNEPNSVYFNKRIPGAFVFENASSEILQDKGVYEFTYVPKDSRFESVEGRMTIFMENSPKLIRSAL